MLKAYDRLTWAAAWLAAWLFFACGVMLCWEVAARYLFTAPTIWAEELARLCMIWGTFLAAAALLARRQHIRISIVTDHLPPGGQRLAELASLLVVLGLCLVCVWYGGKIALDSLVRGRTSGTMLNPPMVFTEASIPLGFAMLGLQALVEAWRLARGETPPAGEPASHE